MVKTIDLENTIIKTVSKRYVVEISSDKDLEIGDETNLCLKVLNENFDIELIKEDFKDMNIRIIKYGNLIIFN
jgi:hypothetical protein